MSIPAAVYIHGRREVRRMIAEALLAGILIGTVVLYLLAPTKKGRS